VELYLYAAYNAYMMWRGTTLPSPLLIVMPIIIH